MGSDAGKRCEDVYRLRENPWGVWDTSSGIRGVSSSSCCGTGVGFEDGQTLGYFDVNGDGIPADGEFQFALQAPPPFFDRVSVYLLRVWQHGGSDSVIVPPFGVFLQMGAGNAYTSKAWAGVKVDPNVNGGFACQDWLFQASGQLSNRLVIKTKPLADQQPSDNQRVRITLRMLLDKCGAGDALVQINNPAPAGFVTKALP